MPLDVDLPALVIERFAVTRTAPKPREERELHLRVDCDADTVELTVLFQCAWYVVSSVGLTTMSQTPSVPVISVAISVADGSPYFWA